MVRHPTTEGERGGVVVIQVIMGQGEGRSRNEHHRMDTDERGRGAIVIPNVHRVSHRSMVVVAGVVAAMVERMTMQKMVPIGMKAAVVIPRRGGRTIEPMAIAETKAIERKVIGVMRIDEGKAVVMKGIDTSRATARKVVERRVIVKLMTGRREYIPIVTPMAWREIIQMEITFIQRVQFIKMSEA